MPNYQLYRAMTELTGQVRLDIGLQKKGTKLFVNNYSLAPICEKIPFQNKINNNDILNNSHIDNIKYLYKQIQGDFYSKRLNNRLLENKTPIILENIYKEGDWQRESGIIPYDQTYEMGLSRISHEKYNKQFAFFCPIWLDEFIRDGEYPELKFRFTMKPRIESNSKNIQPVEYHAELTLKLDDEYEYHNKFVKYIEDYFDTVVMDSKMLYIDTNKTKAYISGINVENGAFVDKLDVNYIVQNLISQERAFKEFNVLICNLFSQNNIIAKQSLNFNFIFDLDDLFYIFDIKNMMFTSFDFNVEVYVNDEKLDVKDYLYNYYDLKLGDLNSGTSNEETPIFEYLEDNFNIDLEKQDIPTPDIPFFSAADYNSIYNFYKGFNKITNNNIDNFLNYDMCDLYATDEVNNNDWVDFETLNDDEIAIKISTQDYTKINILENEYFKLGKVNFKRLLPVNNVNKNDGGISIISNDADDTGDRKFIFYRNSNSDNNKLITYNDDSGVFLIKYNEQTRNFASFLKYINGNEITDVIKAKLSFFNNYVDYNVIVLDEIDIIDVEDTKKNAKIKETQLAFRTEGNNFVSLLRYEGNILPYFCDNKLNVIKKVQIFDKITNENVEKWSKNYAIGLQPNYRSIDFYYLNCDNRIGTIESDLLEKQIEYKNYSSNKYLILKDTYKRTFVINSNQITDSIVLEQFKTVVGDNKNINYLFDLFYYNYKCTNIRLNNDGNLEFTYEITYKLK